ncbi:MAG: DUF7345 domain-containing protein, partial [Halorhabdus sp.]
MARRVAAIGLLLLVVGSMLFPIVGAGGASTTVVDRTVDAGAVPPASPQSGGLLASKSDTTPSLFAVGTSDFDRTVFSIEVYENASARWTFQYTRNLNETEESNFEAFASDFNENETALYTDFLEQAEALTRSGTNVTGRQMNASDVSRSARITPLDDRGIVEMSFTWSQFGQQDGDRVIVSDVFEGGLYLRSDQRLEFVAGPGFAFEEVDPTPSNTSEPLSQQDSIGWVGERTFEDGHPSVVFQPASRVTTIDDGSTTTVGTTTEGAGPGVDTTTDEDGDRTTTVAGGGDAGGFGLPLVFAALAFIAGGIVTAAWLNGYFEPESGDVGAEDGDPDDSPSSAGSTGAGGSIVESTE